MEVLGQAGMVGLVKMSGETILALSYACWRRVVFAEFLLLRESVRISRTTITVMVVRTPITITATTVSTRIKTVFFV